MVIKLKSSFPTKFHIHFNIPSTYKCIFSKKLISRLVSLQPSMQSNRDCREYSLVVVLFLRSSTTNQILIAMKSIFFKLFRNLRVRFRLNAIFAASGYISAYSIQIKRKKFIFFVSRDSFFFNDSCYLYCINDRIFSIFFFAIFRFDCEFIS